MRERIDVVFPVMHGENCEDGAIQGLLQIAGIPYVGPHVAASAACMDKTITKLIASQAGVRQADWQLVTREGFARSRAAVLDAVEAKFPYPVFVKPAGTGSSVGVAKAQGREALEAAIERVRRAEAQFAVNEINTIPGFTSISMYPKLFEASGIPYSELIDDLIALALEA